MTKIISIISNGKRLDIPVKEFVEKCVSKENHDSLRHSEVSTKTTDENQEAKN